MTREARLARDLEVITSGEFVLCQVFVKPPSSGRGFDRGAPLQEKGWLYRPRIDGRGTSRNTPWLSKTGGKEVALLAWDEALEFGLTPYVATPGRAKFSIYGSERREVNLRRERQAVAELRDLRKRSKAARR